MEMPPLQPPQGWQVRVSRSTGNNYFFCSATNESVWHDPALPYGWGWIQEGTGNPRIYVELATGKRENTPPVNPPPPLHTHTQTRIESASLDQLPVLPSLPVGQPQPSAANVGFDVYVPAFRQLGALASEELAWWRSVRSNGDVVSAVPPLLSSLGSANDALASMSGEAVAKAAELMTTELIRAAHVVLGDTAFAACWDLRARRYIIRREAASASASQLSNGSDVASRKRPRTDATSSSEVTVTSTVAMPVLRLATSYPSLRGAALYTDPAFHSSPAIATIYTSGYITTGSGIIRKISSAVGPRESRHMHDLVRDSHATCTTLCVTMALHAARKLAWQMDYQH